MLSNREIAAPINTAPAVRERFISAAPVREAARSFSIPKQDRKSSAMLPSGASARENSSDNYIFVAEHR